MLYEMLYLLGRGLTFIRWLHDPIVTKLCQIQGMDYNVHLQNSNL